MWGVFVYSLALEFFWAFLGFVSLVFFLGVSVWRERASYCHKNCATTIVKGIRQVVSRSGNDIVDDTTPHPLCQWATI